jgi:uncharacterized protein
MFRIPMLFTFCISLLLVPGCSSTMSLYEAIRNDDADAVKEIAKSSKSSLSSFSFSGDSPLLYAMEQGSKNAYVALLEGGADPNRIGPRGANLMTYSAGNSDVFWLKKALENGGDPNLDNKGSVGRRSTPMIAAAREDRIECLKLLVDDFHADIDYIPDFEDALGRAAGSNSFQSVLFLLKSGANYRRKTGKYCSFAESIKNKSVKGFLLEKDQKNFQAVIDWLRVRGVEWDKPQKDGEIWVYSESSEQKN